jgi:hypothetical protein
LRRCRHVMEAYPIQPERNFENAGNILMFLKSLIDEINWVGSRIWTIVLPKWGRTRGATAIFGILSAGKNDFKISDTI